jgi:hypothetical protein
MLGQPLIRMRSRLQHYMFRRLVCCTPYHETRESAPFSSICRCVFKFTWGPFPIYCNILIVYGRFTGTFRSPCVCTHTHTTTHIHTHVYIYIYTRARSVHVDKIYTAIPKVISVFSWWLHPFNASMFLNTHTSSLWPSEHSNTVLVGQTL